MPAASAIEPTLAPIQGAVRAVSSWATTAAPASATMPLPETITLLELKRWAASCGPSEKKRPPIDHDESTASAAYSGELLLLRPNRPAAGGATCGAWPV